MTSQTPAHDFLLPRLTALVEEAVAGGILRDVAVAVLTDLITAPAFNTAAPDPMADSEPRPDREPAPQDGVLMASEKNALIEQVVQPRGFI